MAYEKGSRPEGGFKRRGPVRRRKKVCVFCGKENNEIDYKDVGNMFLKEEKFFLEELLETVLSTRELLQ